MDLAITILLWLVIGAIGLVTLSLIVSLIAGAVTYIRTRKVRKAMTMTASEMMRDIEKQLGGRK